jgi:transposase-like protein
MAKHRTNSSEGQAAGPREGQEGQGPRKTLLEVVVGAAESLFQLSIETGRQVLEKLLEQDRVDLCGAKGEHNARRKRYRHGHDDSGSVVLGGRKVAVRKPRVRQVGGGEVALPTYEQFSQEDPLLTRVYEQMMVGVSTRKYERSLERLPEPLESRATSKSEVSRNFIARTGAQLAEFLGRPLEDLDLPVVMIDGVHLAERVLLVALGIDRDGYKHVLGMWEGTTEQESTCRGLLRGLIERGLEVERPRLFVIDGAKGVRKAIFGVFGSWALVARCRQHKIENVLGHVPDRIKVWVRAKLQRAYNSETEAKAKARLHELADSLQEQYPSAANSVLEGLDETLTVLRLGVGPTLARTLRTTNAIENLNGTFRHVTRRVKHWRSGKMVLRWGASAALEAERKFHRVKGYREIPGLLASLGALCPANKDAALDKVAARA